MNILTTLLGYNCLHSNFVSSGNKEHYRLYCKDYSIFEFENITVTTPNEMNAIDISDCLRIVEEYCNHNTADKKKCSETGCSTISLFEPFDCKSIPTHIKQLYNDIHPVEKSSTHYMSYLVHVNKLHFHIAVEHLANEPIHCYIAGSQRELFEMLTKRYLYNKVTIMNTIYELDTSTHYEQKIIKLD